MRTTLASNLNLGGNSARFLLLRSSLPIDAVASGTLPGSRTFFDKPLERPCEMRLVGEAERAGKNRERNGLIH
jgi:hypothetical protein